MKKAQHQEVLEELTQSFNKAADERAYELTAIAANLTDTELAGFADKVKSILANHAAKVTSEAAPMRARLAYPIKKTQQGVYFIIRFSAVPGVIKQITRDLSLMPDMLRPHIDLLNDHEAKKAATSATAMTAKPPRGWTKREDASEEKTDAPVVEEKKEDKATVEELDKRLDEILGKSN